MVQQSAISRRRFVQTTAASSLALAGMGRGRPAGAQSTKPNIVFILADDLGYADVSCYGQRDYTTPNIDRLAAEGLKFAQAYSNSPDCSSTRTGLITGRYQARLPLGLEEPLTPLTPKDIGLPPSHPTLPSLLKKAGYGTTLIGKWHLGYLPDFSPLKSGYDQFFGILGCCADYFNHGAEASTAYVLPIPGRLAATGLTVGHQPTGASHMRHPKPFVVLQPVAGETKPLFTVYAYTVEQARTIVAAKIAGETIIVAVKVTDR